MLADLFPIVGQADAAPALNQSFVQAFPFPHLVLDNFCADADELQTALRCLPPLESPKWKRAGDKASKKLGMEPGPAKYSIPRLDDMPPVIREAMAAMVSDEFATWLGTVAGIPGLLPDTTLRGAGLCVVPTGGRLGTHVDFNELVAERGPYRRVNAFLYLNPGWQPEWGGNLQLWSREQEILKLERAITPTFNRFVAFESSDRSWHGHIEPVDAPYGLPRVALSSYYFTHERPEWFKHYHSTVYAGVNDADLEHGVKQ